MFFQRPYQLNNLDDNNILADFVPILKDKIQNSKNCQLCLKSKMGHDMLLQGWKILLRVCFIIVYNELAHETMSNLENLFPYRVHKKYKSF